MAIGKAFWDVASSCYVQRYEVSGEKLVDQYSLRIQAVCLSETLEQIYQTTRRLIAEDFNIRIHRQESHI